MSVTRREIIEAAGFEQQYNGCYTRDTWTIRIIDSLVEAFDESRYCILPATIENIKQILEDI